MKPQVSRLLVSLITAIVVSPVISFFMLGAHPSETWALADLWFGTAVIAPFVLVGCVLICWPLVTLLDAETDWPRHKVVAATLTVAALAGQGILYQIVGVPDEMQLLGAGSGLLSAAIWLVGDHVLSADRSRQPGAT